MLLSPLNISVNVDHARPRTLTRSASQGSSRLQIHFPGSSTRTLVGDTYPFRPSLKKITLCEAITGHCPAARHFFPETPCRSPHESQTLFRVFRGELVLIDPPRYDNRPIIVCVKVGHGPEESKALEEEGRFYDTHLAALQDEVVPTFYGFYTAEDKNLGEVSCLVTEYCDGSQLYIEDQEEFVRLIMVATYKLHQAGVMHRHLQSDFRHFVMKGPKLFIVDFTDAILHDCDTCPTIGDSIDPNPNQCRELYNMERKFVNMDDTV